MWVTDLSPSQERQILSDLNIPYEEQVSPKRKVRRVYQAYSKLAEDQYLLPRGYEYFLDEPDELKDRTVCPPVSRVINPTTELRPHQSAVRDILEEFDSGIIHAPTGAGKTVMACTELIAKSRTPVLVINKTRDLCEQWYSRILEHTDATPDQLGWIGGGKWVEGDVTIATWQTLSSRLGTMLDTDVEGLDRFTKSFGMLLVDEAHGVAADKVHEVVTEFYSKYQWGLTATPFRSDEFTRLIDYTLGPIRVSLDRPENSVPIYYDQVKVPNTEYKGAFDWQKLSKRIAADEDRARWIAEDIRENAPTPSLIICVRKSIVEMMMNDLLSMGANPEKVVSITSDTKKKERAEILEKGYRGEYDYILSTTLANEGLDWPPLRSICLTFPGRFEGTVIQQTGRVSRPHPGKKRGLIIDYIDEHGITKSQAIDRADAYRHQGYKSVGAGI